MLRHPPSGPSGRVKIRILVPSQPLELPVELGFKNGSQYCSPTKLARCPQSPPFQRFCCVKTDDAKRKVCIDPGLRTLQGPGASNEERNSHVKKIAGDCEAHLYTSPRRRTLRMTRMVLCQSGTEEDIGETGRTQQSVKINLYLSHASFYFDFDDRYFPRQG